MTYDQIRAIAQDGDIIFLTVDKKNLLSRLTSLVTKSPYTHAAFVFWFKNRLMIVESTTHGGIRIVQASTYKDRDIELLPAVKSWDSIEGAVLEKSGTAEYGWFSAAYIGIRDFMLMNFDIKLPPNNGNRNKACSEFVAEMLGLDDTDLSPKRLYDTIKNQ